MIGVPLSNRSGKKSAFKAVVLARFRNVDTVKFRVAERWGFD